MAFKVACPKAGENPESPRFKLKRSWKEIKLARMLLEENSIMVEDEALATQEALDTAQEMIRSGALDEPPHCSGMGGMYEIMAVTSHSSLKPQVPTNFAFPRASVMSHPWHIIDYHLYLCIVEKNRTLQIRRNGMHIIGDGDCRPFPYREFLSSRRLLSASNRGAGDYRLLFSVLPIVDRTHFGDRDPDFAGRHYILGFDLADEMFYIRQFNWIPNHMDDLWSAWEEGTDVYSVNVADLFNLLRSTFDEGELHVGMGILSASPYCIGLESSDDPGLEIVMVIMICQWLLDFTEVLFGETAHSLLSFKERLAHYMEECRLILQRASYRAWFAARDGCTKKKYKHCSTLNQYVNDLYTYEKSAQPGSLYGKSWRAPGFDTCNRIRQQDRQQRREATERRLIDLFVPPTAEKEAATPSPEKDAQSEDTNSEDGLVFYTPAHSEVPRTPSPPAQHSPSSSPPPLLLSDRGRSPESSRVESPGIITPVSERYDTFEATEYHKIPLSLLLRRALDLVDAQPELDTLSNRGGFGALLTGIGVGVQRMPADNNAIAPAMGYDNNDWRLEAQEGAEGEAPSVRRLLPSPLLD